MNAQEFWKKSFCMDGDVLGKGSYGKVFLFKDRACKIFYKEKYFREELAICKYMLEAKNILKYLKNSPEKCAIYYELAIPLDKWWSKYNYDSNDQIINRIFMDVLKGLQSLKKLNLVHNDIKPANIFIVNRDGQQCFAIGDYGGIEYGCEHKTDKLIVNEKLEEADYSMWPLYKTIDEKRSVHAVAVMILRLKFGFDCEGFYSKFASFTDEKLFVTPHPHLGRLLKMSELFEKNMLKDFIVQCDDGGKTIDEALQIAEECMLSRDSTPKRDSEDNKFFEIIYKKLRSEDSEQSDISSCSDEEPSGIC